MNPMFAARTSALITGTPAFVGRIPALPSAHGGQRVGGWIHARERTPGDPEVEFESRSPDLGRACQREVPRRSFESDQRRGETRIPLTMQATLSEVGFLERESVQNRDARLMLSRVRLAMKFLLRLRRERAHALRRPAPRFEHGTEFLLDDARLISGVCLPSPFDPRALRLRAPNFVGVLHCARREFERTARP